MARNNTLHLAPFQPEVQRKAQQRDALAADVEAFLARGGQIETHPQGGRSEPLPAKKRGKAAKKAAMDTHFKPRPAAPTLTEEVRFEELDAADEALEPDFAEA